MRTYGNLKDQTVEILLPDFDFDHTVERRLSSVSGLVIWVYQVAFGRVLNSLYPYNKPTNVVLPNLNDSCTCIVNLQSSQKTYKAVLELYVLFHGEDEFWYMNPLGSYIETNHLATERAHGAYREVLVTIDGQLVGSVVPFLVIFTGGINPLFWEPVVSIGAFDLPTYDIDFTPLLGILLDNKNHPIGL
ncbi:unnamed protein product [Lactuca virosa]|uniref:Peptide N-acetyl-beta-D-glucosaminyl asparaginase amidase A N-terminal domain-containing protein n=1 Tax=Lactuca virosa TaxID=75947 RepID=A0AAU9P6W6_9ASTR|nr:unnamed protein product [Lactuca virosa]